MRTSLVGILLICFLTTFSKVNACSSDPSLSCSATPGNQVIIREHAVGLPSRDVNQLFGVHLLFWGIKEGLYAESRRSKVSLRAQDIFSMSNVGFIRYGGGVNEIDWRQCVGEYATRIPQKVVSWSPPMKCEFGIHEYEELNDDLGLKDSWHIANVVGVDGMVSHLPRLVKDAHDRAALVKKLAPNRIHFWELGNELDRGELRWSAQKIISRGLPIAKAILEADSSARLLVPLAEYKPEWIDNVDYHNRTLIRNHKAIARDYILHLYYENPPWGPSVANRLRAIRHVASIIRSESVKNPAIWVTEHARTPPGTPADKHWRKGWVETGNHDAVIATSDFLIGVSQIPIVAGAAWHGQGHKVGPWTYIDVDKDGSLSETRMSRLFEFLSPIRDSMALETETHATSEASLSERYAIRASAFLDKHDSHKLAVWVVNRSVTRQTVKVTKESFLGKKLKVKQVDMLSNYHPKSSISSLPSNIKMMKPINNSVTVSLPRKSVSLLEFSAVSDEQS